MNFTKNLFIIGLVTCTLFSSCDKGKGTVTGNVYWEYNKFVGNKPDAGADIMLFSKDTLIKPFEAEADVMGNYKLENIPTGTYLLVVKSKNTTSDAYSQIYELMMNPVYDYFQVSFDTAMTSRILDLHYLSEQASITALGNEKTYDSTAYYRRQCNKLSDSLLADVQKTNSKIKGNFYLGSFGKKIKIKQIKVKKDETVNTITDFGNTYY